MRKARRRNSRSLVSLLLLLSNEATCSSSLILDTSRQALHDGDTKPEQQHCSGSSPSDWDESFSSMGCSESMGRNNPIGSKGPNGAAGTVQSFTHSAAARVRDTLSDDAIPGIDPSAAADTTNHLEIASTPGSPTLSPPSTTTTAQHAHSKISAVLVLNLQDAPLAKLLMTSLRACGGMDIFRDFFVVVPSEELPQIESILQHHTVDDNSNGKSFSCIVHTAADHSSISKQSARARARRHKLHTA